MKFGVIIINVGEVSEKDCIKASVPQEPFLYITIQLNKFV